MILSWCYYKSSLLLQHDLVQYFYCLLFWYFPLKQYMGNTTMFELMLLPEYKLILFLEFQFLLNGRSIARANIFFIFIFCSQINRCCLGQYGLNRKQDRLRLVSGTVKGFSFVILEKGFWWDCKINGHKYAQIDTIY